MKRAARVGQSWTSRVLPAALLCTLALPATGQVAPAERRAAASEAYQSYIRAIRAGHTSEAREAYQAYRATLHPPSTRNEGDRESPKAIPAPSKATPAKALPASGSVFPVSSRGGSSPNVTRANQSDPRRLPGDPPTRVLPRIPAPDPVRIFTTLSHVRRVITDPLLPPTFVFTAPSLRDSFYAGFIIRDQGGQAAFHSNRTLLRERSRFHR